VPEEQVVSLHTHFVRNLLALIPKSHKEMVAALFRTIFAQPDRDAVFAAWEKVRDQLVKTFPKVGPLMDAAKTEVLAFTAFPKAHWIKIWSNNPLERINKEIKRRSRVVGIFPNEDAVIRLVDAVLADAHDEWQVHDAATCPKPRWHCCHPTAILNPLRSPAAREHRGHRPQSPPHRGTQSVRGRSVTSKPIETNDKEHAKNTSHSDCKGAKDQWTMLKLLHRQVLRRREDRSNNGGKALNNGFTARK
jgi:hypothetical protein